MSGPVEMVESRRAHHRGLVLVVLVLVAADAVFALGYYRALTTPPPIYYVPGATAEGRALPDELPEESIRDFALTYLVAAHNFTPETLSRVREAVASRLAPDFVARSRRIYDELQEQARTLDLSVQLAPLDPPEASAVRHLGDGAYEVRVLALYRTYIRSSLSQEGRYEYRVGVRRASPSVANPYGLYVYDLARSRMEETP
ncbi:MAG: hypothetical protein HY722_04800 [Planctomycetes bacterium]|nr:hypothetical protein [Planctomycetota bacterium]